MHRYLSQAADRLTAPATFGRRLFVIVLVAILARAVTFGNPIVHVDEEFYFVTAQAWAHGALPYVDIWDRKPVGLFLIYLPAAALGTPLGIWAYQALALASLVATAMLIARLADKAGWNMGALVGALAYVLWVDFVDGQGGQAPIFYNLLIIGAAALILPRSDDSGLHRRGIAAMVLVGLALQVKYSVIFEGMFFGWCLLWREWRAGRRWAILPYGAALVAAAALPTLLAWAAFAAIGAGDAWFYANFASILDRKADPMFDQFGNLAKILLITSPLIAAAVLAFRPGGEETAETSSVRLWLFGWLMAAAIGLLLFGAWFEHYSLPLLVPLAVCAAGFFGDHRDGPRIALPLLLVVFIGGQITLVSKLYTRGTSAQFHAIADAIGHGPGCLYVYSGETALYPASARCALTRYIFPSHLGRVRETGAVGVDQIAEIRRILALKPTIVVMRPAYAGERPDTRAVVTGEVQRHYRLQAVRPLGNQQIEIFALR